MVLVELSAVGSEGLALSRVLVDVLFVGDKECKEEGDDDVVPFTLLVDVLFVGDKECKEEGDDDVVPFTLLVDVLFVGDVAFDDNFTVGICFTAGLLSNVTPFKKKAI